MDLTSFIPLLCLGMAVLHGIGIFYYVKKKKIKLSFKRKQKVSDLQIIRPEFRKETQQERERLAKQKRKQMKIIK